MGTIKADTVTGLADPNKATIPNTITMGSTTATLNFGNTVIANASAGSSTVTAEGGSTTTNLQQGLCKHWIRHNDGASIDDSFNNTSLTDNGAGNYTATIANDFGSNQTVSVTGGGSNGTNGDDCFSNCSGSALGTASMKCRQVDETLKDNEHSNIQCWGDLA